MSKEAEPSRDGSPVDWAAASVDVVTPSRPLLVLEVALPAASAVVFVGALKDSKEDAAEAASVAGSVAVVEDSEAMGLVEIGMASVRQAELLPAPEATAEMVTVALAAGMIPGVDDPLTIDLAVVTVTAAVALAAIWSLLGAERVGFGTEIETVTVTVIVIGATATATATATGTGTGTEEVGTTTGRRATMIIGNEDTREVVTKIRENCDAIRHLLLHMVGITRSS